MNLEKMKKTAGWMEKIVRILQKVVVIAVAAAVCIVAVWAIANAAYPGITIPVLTESIDLGALTITVSPEYQPAEDGIPFTTWIILALCGVFAAGIWYILGVLGRIFRPMKEGDPFSATVSRDIRKIGWAVVVMGVVSNLVQVLEITDMWNRFGQVMETGDLITAVSLNYTLDANFLVIFAVLLLVSWIFEYGTELQKLSDETL